MAVVSAALLQARAEGALAELYAQTRAADEARPRELAAALVLQKHGRGYLVRKRLDQFRDVTVDIQRAWRGYLGRQQALAAREQRDKRLREAYFDTKATNIQRHWRGFWSRKFLFDFYARKLYLQHVARVNAQVRAEVAEEGERSAVQQKALAEAAARKAFETKVAQLHHLISTTSQPGIFASPYALATNTVPVIAGAPVEEHLKQVSKKTGRSLRTSMAASLESTRSRPTHSPTRPPAQHHHHHHHRYPQPHHRPHAPPTFLPPIARGSASPTQKSAAAAALVDARSEGEGLGPGGAAGGGQGGFGGGAAHAQAHGTGAATNSAGFAVTHTHGHGGSGALKGGGTLHREPPPYATTYPPEAEVAGRGVTVPRHITLRQVVPYDAVREAELLEKKVAHAEMLMRYPLPFSHNCSMAYVPALPVQTSRNLEPFYDPNEAHGVRSGRFSISKRPFLTTAKQDYLDQGLQGDVTSGMPVTAKPLPSPIRAAGVTCAELRVRNKEPPRD